MKVVIESDRVIYYPGLKPEQDPRPNEPLIVVQAGLITCNFLIQGLKVDGALLFQDAFAAALATAIEQAKELESGN